MKKTKLFVILFFILIGLFVFHKPIYVYTTNNTKVVVIKSLDHKVFKSGDKIKDKYLVFTDNGVFENTDTFFYFKWNSSDVQNSLKQGQKVKIHYYGWRIPFFSWYPNIVSVKTL